MNLDLPTLTRLGKGTLMLWALALLLSVFAPPSSAATRATRVVVLEHGGAGTAPEAAVERLGGRVERQIPLVRGFVARLPWRGVAPLRRSAGVRSVNRDRRFALRRAAPRTRRRRGGPACRRRAAIRGGGRRVDTSRTSPASWPSVSLIVLKSSRSM